jgi:uncharacterized membrane protein
MNIVLWLVQGLLAVAYLAAGYTHALRYEVSIQRPEMAWMADLPRPMVVAIGGLEMLGAIGLILPAASGILPWLTPLAAAGLATMMGLAVFFHLARRESQAVAVTLGLGLIAGFVAYGRFVLEPFT